MKNYNPYDGGKAAFDGDLPQKPTDNKTFMQYYASLEVSSGEGEEMLGKGRALRELKQEAILEWKKGWLEAKSEAEKPKPVAKKKTKKKATKKKVAKKKVSKKKSEK